MSKRSLIGITAVLLAVFLGAAHLRAQEVAPWQFGVIEAYEAPNAARALPAAWTRTTLQWAEVQAEGPDSWTPELTDPELDAQLADGREVLGLLIGIPDWALDADGLPSGLWLDPDDPGNLWANYVREAVTRYAGRIDHWIIWNEPDIDATALAHTWNGTVDDFYQLQRVAYLVAKESNPDSVIHLAAFTYWADVHAGREQYMTRLLDRIMADPQAAAHNDYFDVATAHLYFQSDQIYDLLLFFRGLMVERGLERPIWLIETNAPPYNDASWPVESVTLAVTENEQAAFISQAVPAALAAGAERIGVFKLRDTETDRQANPEPFGLLRLDGSHRPAYTAYQVAIKQMSGVRDAQRLRWDEIGQFQLLQEDRRTMVLFSRLPAGQTAVVPALAQTALLVNMWGEAEVIEAQDGRYEIELQPALCTQTIGDYCMIGGTTLYLVEALEGGPPPEEAAPLLPPPLIVPTLLPTPTVPATATGTATPEPPQTPTAAPTVTPAATMTAVPSITATVLPTVVAPPAPTVTIVPLNGEVSGPDRTHAILGAAIVLGLLGLAGVIFRLRRDKR